MVNPRLTKLLPWAALLVMGVLWGLSFSLARIVTAAGGTPFGVTFWQSVVCGVILLGLTLASCVVLVLFILLCLRPCALSL